MTTLTSGLIQSVDWVVLAPPTITAVVALAVLIADLFVPTTRKPLLGQITVGGLVIAGLSLLPLLHGGRATFCLTTGSHECSYVADHFTLGIQLLVLGGALLVALLSLHRPAHLPARALWFPLLSPAPGPAPLPAARDLP